MLLTVQGDDRAREGQGLLCGALQAIIVRLNAQTVIQHADTLMMMFLSVLQAKSATLNEEVHIDSFTSTPFIHLGRSRRLWRSAPSLPV